MLIVLIESDAGKIVSDFSFCGYLGAEQAKWFDKEEYEIKNIPLEHLSFHININKSNYILPIGSLEFMKKAAEVLGFSLPKPINIPDSLKEHCGRKTWESNLESLQFPCFIKPLNDAKLFTGFVAKSHKDFILYPELSDVNNMLFFCSEPINNILSEWRCFVINGKVVNCSNYSGDPLVFPDKEKINFLVDKYYDAPKGYSLDVFVTETETQLVEINDGWSLGSYGCHPEDYFKLLKARWFEILRNKTFF